MKLSIVIPTISSRKQMLDELLKSIPDVETIIMDDESMPLSQKRNKGFKKSTGDFILFIDDDNVVSKGSIEAALSMFDNKDVGIVGFVGCYSTDRIKVCDGGSFRLPIGFTYDKYVNKSIAELWYEEARGSYKVDEVANAFMIRRKVFDYIGLFDETFPMDMDEADFCLRARQNGYIVCMCTKAIVYHNSATYSRIPNFRRPKNAYYMGRNRIIFNKKHSLGLWFVPLFVSSYVLCLIIKLNISMIPHFIKGVRDGLRYKVNSQR